MVPGVERLQYDVFRVLMFYIVPQDETPSVQIPRVGGLLRAEDHKYENTLGERIHALPGH